MEALAKSGRYEVVWAVGDTIQGSWRAEQGWPSFQTEAVNLVVAPSPDQVKAILETRKSESLHIFTGVHNEAFQRDAFLMAMSLGCRGAMQNEYNPAKPGRGLLKRIAHTAYQKKYGKQIEAVFCIGHKAREWYRSVGYADNILIDWMYTPQPAESPHRDSWGEKRAPRIFFVSSLIPRKGIDLLVDALLSLREFDWQADIYGGGELQDQLVAQVEESGIADRFTFGGYLPNHEAMAKLADADLAVVPSRHDGWGTVVNEALLLGVPVLATKQAGGSDIVVADWLGFVAPEATVENIRQGLQALLPRLPMTSEERERIYSWAKQRLTGESAANHLAASLDAIGRGDPPPTAPWRKPE